MNKREDLLNLLRVTNRWRDAILSDDELTPENRDRSIDLMRCVRAEAYEKIQKQYDNAGRLPEGNK